MKTIKILLLLGGLSAGISILLAQQPAPGDATPAAPSETAATTAAAPAVETASNAVTAAASDLPDDPVLRRMREKAAAERAGAVGGGTSTEPAAAAATETPAMEPDAATPSVEPAHTPSTTASAVPATMVLPPGAYDGEGIRMNFENAPLDNVLTYLSKAAGFVIVKEVSTRGRVSIVSQQPLSKEEVVSLLNTALYRNGCGAYLRNRTLTIVSADEIKSRGVPTILWDGNPDSIPQEDVVVTMVLPVRFVAVTELIQNLLPLVSPSTPLTANTSGNSIIMTDTQNNIHRVAELIKAVDSGAEDVTLVKVFTLKYANAQEIADELTTVFANNNRGGTAAQTPMAFGGGGRGGGRGGAAGGAAGGQNTRMRNRSPVVAMADMRTASVIVTASRDLMDNVADTIRTLDEEAGNARNEEVSIFNVNNAEPSQVLQVLQDIFNNRGGTTRIQNTALTQRQQQSTTMGTSSFSSSGFGGSSGMGGGRTGGGRTSGGGGGFGGGF
jgi:general secretion pathway protein D